MNYDNEIELAKERDVIVSGHIFDFRGTPFENLCDEFYGFCRQHLNDNSERYNIEPSIFIYTGFVNSNAAAQYKNDTFSIHINMGLIKKCCGNYLQNRSLDEYFEKQCSDGIKHYDVPISALAYQVATQFTYYHEFAHLVQFEKRRQEKSLQERFGKKSTYDHIKQRLEINADTFASIAIASHIQQYIKKTFRDNITPENVEFTVVALCACLLNHMAQFCDNLPEIYFKEHEHPHPFIRLFAANLNILNYLNQSDFFKEDKIEINQSFIRILDFYEELEINEVFDTKLTEAMKSALDQQKEIGEYMRELMEFNLKEYNNAIEQWNKFSA